MEIDHDNHPQLLGDLIGTESDPTSLVALRDLLGAVADDLASLGGPMAALYATALADELDAIGIGR